MNIIFLDIDGCLNSELYYRKRGHIKHEELNDIKSHAEDIDPEAIELLNDFIDKTKCEIVISSTWRNLGVKFLQQVFEVKGFKHKILDTTPYGCTGCLRGNEILQWIKNNEKLLGKYYSEFNSYVIFDDDSDMLYWQKNNFMLIDGVTGITRTIMYRANRILERNK